jgi:hypothetical protein
MSALAICHEEREKLRVFKIAQAVFLFQLNSAFSLHLSYESDVSWTGQRLPTILIGETKTARTGGKESCTHYFGASPRSCSQWQ